MQDDTKAKIKSLIMSAVMKKLENYAPETEHRPFIKALLSEEVIYIASFVQSLNTTFGMSIYEQIGQIIAEDAGAYAQRQYPLIGFIDAATSAKITEIWEQVKTSGGSNKAREIEEIRSLISRSDSPARIPESMVDLIVRKPDGQEAYFDITTVKPNKKEFEALKRKMLLWAALRLSTDNSARLGTYIAIPYNPYYPNPYFRWNTASLDPNGDIMVQEDFWNFLGDSDNTYEELLGIFNEAGDILKQRVAEFLKEKQ
jgi:hypothetical protein